MLLASLIACGAVMATEKPEQSFVADARVQQIAERYAAEAVRYSKEELGIALDWTDASIVAVEAALARIHVLYASTQPRPTEQQAMVYAHTFGSYIGEVYRRNHHGEWGIVILGGQQFPGLKTKSGTNFWPSGRALNRITCGAENNVADYYKALLERQPSPMRLS